jgi:calcium permeable stress-gated cation channel
MISGLAWYENIPLYSLLSISVYKRYYAFLVLYVLVLSLITLFVSNFNSHGFLIVTISSGITSTIMDVRLSQTS